MYSSSSLCAHDTVSTVVMRSARKEQNIHTYTYTNTHVIHMHTHAYICTYTHTFINTHAHIYTYTHMTDIHKNSVEAVICVPFR